MSNGFVRFLKASGGGGGSSNLIVGATPITSGLKTSILFQSDADEFLDESQNFIYDKASNRLGVNTASPSTTLQVNGTSTLQNILPLTTNVYDIGSTTQYYNLAFINNVRTSTLRCVTNAAGIGFEDTAGTARMKFFGNGRLVVGGNTDSGYALDVLGTARISGKTAIGGTPVVPSALLECVSTSQGFMLPRMTTTQKNAISSPAAGLQVYDITLSDISTYNGTVWAQKKNGNTFFQVPKEFDFYKAAAGNGNTLLFGSPYPLIALQPNIININLFFHATQGSVNSTLRIYASSSPTSVVGAVQIGNFLITTTDYAAGNDSVGLTLSFAFGFGSGYSLVSQGTGINNNFSVLARDTPSLGSFILNLPFICVTCNNLAVLDYVQLTYAN